jgi:hypothetical protein
MRGYIARAQAERWQALAAARQRLQHHYADLPARRGAEIYERAEALLAELPCAKLEQLHKLGCAHERVGDCPATGDRHGCLDRAAHLAHEKRALRDAGAVKACQPT